MIAFSFKKRNLGPIGLHIDHGSVKMIQVSVDENGTNVLSADQVYIPIDKRNNGAERKEFIIFSIKQMLSKGNFNGTDVVSVLPSDKLKITSLRLGNLSDDQVEQALWKEVESRFGFNPEKDVINYINAGIVRQNEEIKNEYVLFAASNETIKDHLEMIEQAELCSVGIDVVPCALFRCFERSFRRREDMDRTIVFLNVGSMFTTVAFCRDGEINFVKQIPIGCETFNQKIAKKLGVEVDEVESLQKSLCSRIPQLVSSTGNDCMETSYQCNSVESGKNDIDMSTLQIMTDTFTSMAEELCHEISLCFKYYGVTFRGQNVEHVVLAGCQLYEETLLDIFRQHLSVDVEVNRPLKGFNVRGIKLSDDRRACLSDWAVAVGLCLKGLDGCERGEQS